MTESRFVLGESIPRDVVAVIASGALSPSLFKIMADRAEAEAKLIDIGGADACALGDVISSRHASVVYQTDRHDSWANIARDVLAEYARTGTVPER